MANKMRSSQKATVKPKYNRVLIMLSVVIILIALIPILRPGIYTIQPVNSIPEGATIIYIFRPTGEPFFTSLDPECVFSPTSVSLICNALVQSKFKELSGKIILRLPFNHEAYLKGSNGVEPGIYNDET
jgi:hypothetical protein